MTSGDHDIKVEYYEADGGAIAQFRWEKTGASSGGLCDGATSIYTGQTVGGTISNSSQWYCFTAPRGWISVRLFRNSGSLDPVARLFRGSQQLGENDDEDTIGSADRHSFFSSELPVSGGYRLQVDRYGLTTGAYKLRIDVAHKVSSADVNSDCTVNSCLLYTSPSPRDS